MRGVRLDMNGSPSKGELQGNQLGIGKDQKGIRHGTSGDGQGLSDEDESRLNVNDGCAELVEAPTVQLTLQPQGPQVPPTQVVRWDRFLPLRSLKVLLVENDDSTRHVVSALLRNCSYEVAAVVNGLEAWKILEDLTNHVDLVLTELDMPFLSGIGLLSKIMNHKTRKNIPVIMMSSNDNMGIVFKCFSKGATDFLVKPIRKNELKNLWQHVWRKCHSSSGSGSESGIRTQKSIKSKSVEGSENNTDSNDEDDNESIGLNAMDGSDNGSGTQNSWSKRAAEIDSPQPMSPWDELADPPDSTCAQVIHPRPEMSQKLESEHDNVGTCNELDLQLRGPSHNVLDTIASAQKVKGFDLESREGKKLDRGKVDLNDETPRLGTNDTGLGGTSTDLTIPQKDSTGNKVPGHPSKISHIRNMAAAYDTKEGPSLELSLKHHRDASDTGITAQERNVLRHSDLSAFSRYNNTNNSRTANQAPTGNVGSCSPVDNSSEAAKTELMHNLVSGSSGTPNARSNGSSNNNDMGSTTNNASTKPEAFQPVHHANNSSLKPVSDSPAGAMNQQIQVQHHHHHYHHHHHHVHNMQQQKQLNRDSAPSDIFGANTEGNTAGYGSASGSNNGSGQNGSSRQNGSSTAIIGEGTNVTSENGEAGKCGPGDVIGSGSMSGEVDQNRAARREAALNKFRQKRKERCFEKKVRYQSRKRLAEQRPRVRGQFVRQAADENKRQDKSEDADS